MRRILLHRNEGRLGHGSAEHRCIDQLLLIVLIQPERNSSPAIIVLLGPVRNAFEFFLICRKLNYIRLRPSENLLKLGNLFPNSAHEQLIEGSPLELFKGFERVFEANFLVHIIELISLIDFLNARQNLAGIAHILFGGRDDEKPYTGQNSQCDNNYHGNRHRRHYCYLVLYPK